MVMLQISSFKCLFL